MASSVRDTLQFSILESQKFEPFLPPAQPQGLQTQAHGRPFVTLTFATSLDSQLAIAPGVQTAISGPQSKAMTHFLRSRHDAILIGVGTVLADNPSLNCRIEGVGGYGGEGLERQPRPIIIDPNGRWRFTSESKVMKLAAEGKGKAPFIVTRVEPLPGKRSILEEVGGRFLLVSDVPGRPSGDLINWNVVLSMLSHEGLNSVMIEGGGFVINDMLGSGDAYSMIDSIIITIAPTWLGKGGVQVCPGEIAKRLPITRLRSTKWLPLGDDVVLCGFPDLELRKH